MSSARYRSAETLAADFAVSTRGHTLAVLRDDGPYRHLTFTDRPGASVWSWNVVTWPGGLAVDGWRTFTFAGGQDDLLAFLRPRRLDGAADPAAWAQVVSSGETRQFSPQVLATWACQEAARNESACPGVSEAVHAFAGPTAPATARDAVVRLDEFCYEPGQADELFRFDYREAELDDWSEPYLWDCRALAAVISAYDRVSPGSGTAG